MLVLSLVVVVVVVVVVAVVVVVVVAAAVVVVVVVVVVVNQTSWLESTSSSNATFRQTDATQHSNMLRCGIISLSLSPSLPLSLSL